MQINKCYPGSRAFDLLKCTFSTVVIRFSYFVFRFSFLAFSLYFLVFDVFANDSKTVFVVSHGWHTGLVIAAKDLPDSLRKQPAFPKTAWVEFGWGDREFYQNPDFSFWTTAKAAIWPTESVMHVAGFDTAVKDYFSLSERITIKVGESRFNNMLHYIAQSFSYDSSGSILFIRRGLYGKGGFFASSRTYIWPKTCNVWTAACLEAAGLDITPIYYQRASRLMRVLREMELN